MCLANDDYWDRLLRIVAEGHAVPVVGRDLLMVETETGPRLYHQLVAERLAAELKVPTAKLPLNFDTNDVVCAYEGFHGDHTKVNKTVAGIINSLKVPVPEPLKLLAEIVPLRLFISTTGDALLEEALAKVRDQPPALVVCPPTNRNLDFDEALLEQHGSLVFQILGRVSYSTQFAVTEGQVLERMHDLMAGQNRPKKLIERLWASHLLILGVSFPDWLARFLLRLARERPLWDSRTFEEFIAEDNGRGQQELASFLRNFSPNQSSLFTGGSPIDFVRELHRRWKEQPTAPSNALATGEKPADMDGGSIFISYATEDQAAAFRLAEVMTSKNLDVWVDKRLKPGDDFFHIIERHIEHCCAFVPVLSRHTQAEDERWFRQEWALACARSSRLFGTERGFLFPVVVDATPIPELTAIRRKTFGERTTVPAPGGLAPKKLLEQLDDTQKAWRKQFTRT